MRILKKPLSEISIYGKLILLIGILIAVPLLVVPFYPQEARHIPAFLLPLGISIVLGLALCLFTQRRERPAARWQSPLHRGSLPVLLAWSFAFLVGAIPFALGRQLSPLLSLFESVGGWTTAGMSVADVSRMPHIFLFYRAFMQYCGGLGFVIMIAMLVQGKQNMNLYNAEGHPDRLMPSLKRTSRTIFLLYSCFLAAGILAYWLCGMRFFDALCHAMSALSTAGFSTRAGGIAQYNSTPIELITIALMLLGSTNFAILLLLVKGHFRKIFRVSEVRFMLGLLFLFVSLATVSLMHNTELGFGQSLLESLFGIVSTMTTTGYSTMNYALWPSFALGLMMILMFIGGSIGSTSGGIKLLRAYLLLRIMKENVQRRLSPPRRVTAPSHYRVQGKMPIDQAMINDTIGFVACYIAIFIVGALLLTLTANCSLFEAIFEFASAFGTVGFTGGLATSSASAGTLFVLMAGMILGRLEIFVVFIGIYAGVQRLGATKIFQKKAHGIGN